MSIGLLLSLTSFGFIVLASRQIGAFFTRFNLPLISGYLLAGIFAGPFVLQFATTSDLESLRFLDDAALAFIAFAAGSELNISELRPRIRSIAWHSLGQIIAIFTLGTLTIFVLAEQLPFLQSLPTSARLATGLITGAILVARSPSSTIAIITELRARGSFTRTILGVTVLMDVVVVILFAIATSFADLLFTVTGFNLFFLVILILEIAGSFVMGILIGYVLDRLIMLRIHKYIKTSLILILGFAVFEFTHWFRVITHATLPFELLLEPLLICMVGSFFVTNRSAFRDEFIEIVETAGPIIFLVFFTLIGDELQLDLLRRTLLFALIIFGVRLLGLFIGSYLGGQIVGDPPLHNRYAWMAYVTQAGIGLGLAKEAAVEFPQLGEEFATLIISTIVISQLAGPPLLNNVLRWVGEASLPRMHIPDQIRNAVIFGFSPRSAALARKLHEVDWQVTIADSQPAALIEALPPEINRLVVAAIDEAAVRVLVNETTDAVISMLGDDENNFKTCTFVREYFSVPRLLTCLHDMDNAERFRTLGVTYVDKETAFVTMLAEYTIAPQTAAMLLHNYPNYEIVQVTITNPDLHGLRVRDVRLPNDVLVLSIIRSGEAIVPHGHSVVQLNDELTLIGHSTSLKRSTLKLGY